MQTAASRSLTQIQIWQVRKEAAFPTGVKYAFYLIGPPPERSIVVGYDNHHGKGHHRHAGSVETQVTTPSVTTLLQRFRREVTGHLRAKGIAVREAP
jgi:hypothetical protein